MTRRYERPTKPECQHVARTPLDDPDDISELLPRARVGWTRHASDEMNRAFVEMHKQRYIRVVARCETCGDLIFQRTAKARLEPKGDA